MPSGFIIAILLVFIGVDVSYIIQKGLLFSLKTQWKMLFITLLTFSYIKTQTAITSQN